MTAFRNNSEAVAPTYGPLPGTDPVLEWSNPSMHVCYHTLNNWRSHKEEVDECEKNANCSRFYTYVESSSLYVCNRIVLLTCDLTAVDQRILYLLEQGIKCNTEEARDDIKERLENLTDLKKKIHDFYEQIKLKPEGESKDDDAQIIPDVKEEEEGPTV